LINEKGKNMHFLKPFSIFVCAGVIIGAIGFELTRGTHLAASASWQALARLPGGSWGLAAVSAVPMGPASSLAATRYVIDLKRSDIMVRAFSGGIARFKGHDHFVRPSEFSGEVELTPGAITPASLRMTIRAASVEETRPILTPPQKQIINKELKEIVLQPDQFPDITLKSTDVTVTPTSGGHFDAKIGGDLTLHGVTRHIVIPADVAIEGNSLRAKGEVEFERSDFNVKATTAMHGMIRVHDHLKLTFDIVANQL
jgi:polyisoprenoid-binding protein YceI